VYEHHKSVNLIDNWEIFLSSIYDKILKLIDLIKIIFFKVLQICVL